MEDISTIKDLTLDSLTVGNIYGTNATIDVLAAQDVAAAQVAVSGPMCAVDFAAQTATVTFAMGVKSLAVANARVTESLTAQDITVSGNIEAPNAVIDDISSININATTFNVTDATITGNLDATEVSISGNIDANTGNIETLIVQDFAATEVFTAPEIAAQKLYLTDSLTYELLDETAYKFDVNESKLTVRKGSASLLELSED